MSKNKKNAPAAPAAPVSEVEALRAEVERLREQVARQEAYVAADVQRVYDAVAARRREQAARAERLGVSEASSDARIVEGIWAEVAGEVAALAAVAADPTSEGVRVLRKGRFALTELQLQLALLTRGYIYTSL